MTKGYRRILVITVILALGTLTACREALVHNVDEVEANRIVSVLQKYGIMAAKKLDNPETNTWSVDVPKRDASRAWSILQEYKLPRKAERRFRDVFGQSKLIVTPIEERALFIEALQGEIAHTLESIDGVIDARVHLVLPEEDLSGELKGDAKASVMIEYQPTAQGATPLQIREVQLLVAHAVEALNPDNVAVILKPSALAAPLATPEANYELVSMGPLVLEKGSLTPFKVMFAVVLLVFLFLGLLIYWQGRIINRLRAELKVAQRELRSIQRRGAA